MGGSRPAGTPSRAEAEDGADLWRRAMRDTRRLSSRRRHGGEVQEPAEDPSPPVSEVPRDGARPAAAPGRSPRPQEPAPPGTLDRHVARRLKRGAQDIEARLDLHGMTRKDAHAELRRFVRDAAACGRRCVLVITGKGSRVDAGSDSRDAAPGVLRRSVPRWLEDADLSPYVAGFGPALPKHGGAGALYVQLRRRRPGGRG